MTVAPNKSKKGINFDEKTGIITAETFWSDWTEIYTATIDLKKFFKEFANHLENNKDLPFTDVLGDEKSNNFIGGYSAGSEFAKPGPHLTRSKKCFEKQFLWAKYAGFNEVEVIWKARSKSKFSKYGWLIFKLDFNCRIIKDVEVVVNGEKKIMQQGRWEFRNTLTYYNSYIRDYLWVTPFFRNFAEIQRLMIDHTYFDYLDRDIGWMKNKIKPLLWKIIHKTFRE